jgi:hypothetical protein
VCAELACICNADLMPELRESENPYLSPKDTSNVQRNRSRGLRILASVFFAFLFTWSIQAYFASSQFDAPLLQSITNHEFAGRSLFWSLCVLIWHFVAPNRQEYTYWVRFKLTLICVVLSSIPAAFICMAMNPNVVYGRYRVHDPKPIPIMEAGVCFVFLIVGCLILRSLINHGYLKPSKGELKSNSQPVCPDNKVKQ